MAKIPKGIGKVIKGAGKAAGNYAVNSFWRGVGYSKPNLNRLREKVGLSRGSGSFSKHQQSMMESDKKFAEQLKKNLPQKSLSQEISRIQNKGNVFRVISASMTASTLQTVRDPRIDEKQKFNLITEAVGRDISLLNRNFKIVQTRIETLEQQTSLIAGTVDKHTETFKSLHKKILDDVQKKLRTEEGMDELYQFKKPSLITGAGGSGGNDGDEDDDDLDFDGLGVDRRGRRRRRGRRGRRGQRKNQRRTRSQRRASRWRNTRTQMASRAKELGGLISRTIRIGVVAGAPILVPAAIIWGMKSYEESEFGKRTGEKPEDLIDPNRATRENGAMIADNIDTIIGHLEESNGSPLQIGFLEARKHKALILSSPQQDREFLIDDFFEELKRLDLTPAQIQQIINSADTPQVTKRAWDNIQRAAKKAEQLEKRRKNRTLGKADRHPEFYDPPGSGASQRKRSQTSAAQAQPSAPAAAPVKPVQQKAGAATQRRKSRTQTTAGKRTWSEFFWGKSSKLGGPRDWDRPMKLGGPGAPDLMSGYKDEWSDTVKGAASRYKGLNPNNYSTYGRPGQKTTNQTYQMSHQEWDTYKSKREFLKFGKLPGGFESMPGHMGLLGMPGMVAARGAQPFGGGGGRMTGGSTPTYGSGPIGDFSPSSAGRPTPGVPAAGTTGPRSPIPSFVSPGPGAPAGTLSPGQSPGWAPPMKLGGPVGKGEVRMSAGLAKLRQQKFAKELQNPAVRRQLAALMKIETGGMSAASKADWLETLVNRAGVSDASLMSRLRGRNRAYWGGGIGNPRSVSESQLKEFDSLAQQVLQGRDRTQGATDNASNQPGNRLADSRMRKLRNEGRPQDGRWTGGAYGKGEFVYIDTPYKKRTMQYRERAARIEKELAKSSNAGVNFRDPEGLARAQAIIKQTQGQSGNLLTSSANADALVNRPRPQPGRAGATKPGGTQHLGSTRTSRGRYGLALPLETGTMMHRGHGNTSEFGYARGRLHAGVDLYAVDPENRKLRVGNEAKVFAPEDGTILSVRRRPQGTGNRAGAWIEVRDKRGMRHRFLHSDPNLVNPSTGKPWKEGDSVKKGQHLTYVTGSGTDFGRTSARMGSLSGAVKHFDQKGWGSTNMPHAHYELRMPNGKLIDPGLLYPEFRTGRDRNKKSQLFGVQPEPPPLPSLRPKGMPTKDFRSSQDIETAVTGQATEQTPTTPAEQRITEATRPAAMQGKPNASVVGQMTARRQEAKTPVVPQKMTPEQRAAEGIASDNVGYGSFRGAQMEGMAPDPTSRMKMAPQPSTSGAPLPHHPAAAAVGREQRGETTTAQPTGPEISQSMEHPAAEAVDRERKEAPGPKASPDTGGTSGGGDVGGGSGGSSGGGGLLGGLLSGGDVPGFKHNPETEAPQSGTSGYGSQGRCFV